MSDQVSDRRHGQCLCGAVRFSAIPANAEAAVCHCEMCRRWMAGPFFAVDYGENFEFDGGDDDFEIFRSPDWAERGFCRKCGTPLMWNLHGKKAYHVSLPAFDDIGDVTFTTEIFIDRKPAYFDFTNETKQMTGAEVFAMFAGGQDD